MTATDEVAASKSPVFTGVLRAYRNVLGRPGAMLCISSLPVAAIVALTVFYSRIPWQDHPASGFYFLSFILPLSFLALAWTRYCLLDRTPRFLPVRPWGTAYAKVLACYIGWTLLLIGVPFALVLIGGGLTSAVLGHQGLFPTYLQYAPLALLCLVLLGIISFSKFFLALPLIATEQPATPGAAWKLEAGMGLRLGAMLLLLAVSLLTLAALCIVVISAAVQAYFAALEVDLAQTDRNYLVAEYIDSIVACVMAFVGAPIGTALFAETLSITYREITGWTGAQQAIVERFE